MLFPKIRLCYNHDSLCVYVQKEENQWTRLIIMTDMLCHIMKRL